jgi:ribonuclease R
VVAKVNPADRTIDYVLSTDNTPLKAVDSRSGEKKRKSGPKRSADKTQTITPKKKTAAIAKPKKSRTPKKK